MANQMLNVINTFQKLVINSRCKINHTLIKPLQHGLPNNQVIFTNSTRNTNFFNKAPAAHLWKAITSVSNAGKKRGRGKTISKKNIKDLNRGQIIGLGKANIQWPGLNTPIIRGKELLTQHQLPEDPDREKKLIELRDRMGVPRRQKLNPFERGWSGGKVPGRSIGPPDPVLEDKFDGFDTKVLESKIVFNMTANYGRKRHHSVLSVTGNKLGLAGFALGKAQDAKTAIRKSKNRAAQKLLHVNLFRNHTICHDFYSAFGATKLYVFQRPQGHGLVCHRAIKTICETIGIKDIYAKVEGSTNVGHVTKAFFLGLLKQKSHKQIAEEKGMHVVEFSEENDYFPTVIGSPEVCKRQEEIKKDEILDFTQYCFDGKVVLKKKKFPPFYSTYKTYERHLKRQEQLRNQPKVKQHLIAEYGEIRSFLADKYPECTQYRKPIEKADEEEETS